MKKRQILAFLLSLVLVVSAFSILPASAVGESTYAATIPISALLADGAKVTAGTVYSIANKEDMLTFAQVCNEANGWFAGATVVLTADVDMNPGWVASETAPATEWVPIKLFSGTFDGQGHTLSGIYAKGILGWGNNTSEEACGLFQTIGGKNVTVKNLNLTNSYLKAAKYIGSIVGNFSNATDNTGALISHVTSDAIVVSTNNLAGGIVGGAFSTANTASAVITIENCVFNGSVSVNSDVVGGIIAVSWRPLAIRNCVNNGKLSFTGANSEQPKMGGIIGKVEGGALCDITGCVNMADITLQTGVTNTTSAVGGIIGWYATNAPVLNMTDCVNIGKLASGNNSTGGMVGVFQKASGNFTRCLNTGVFAGGAVYYSGGMIGCFNLSTANNSGVVTFTDCMYAYQSYTATNGQTLWLNGVGVYAEKAENCTRNIRVVNHSSGKDVSFNKSSFGSGAWANFVAINKPFFDTQCAVNGSNFTGLNALARLTAFDWVNGWELYGNTPVPQQAAKLIKASREEKENGVDFYGVQFSKAADGKFDVRMVATVDSLDYSKAGFEVNFLYNGKAASYTLDSATVYEKLTYRNLEKEDAEAELFSVDGKWLCALAVEEVPASGTFVLEITAFSADSEGNVSGDDTAICIFTNGTLAYSYLK